MPNTENEIWRAIINWIIPSALTGAIIQVATRMLRHDITWTGALISATLAIALAFLVGTITHLYWESIPGTIMATSVTSLISREISMWFVYGLKMDDALSDIFGLILEKIKRLLK
jgi:hypothetical protein